MKIPFTVPQIVFKAYDRHVTEEQLKAQSEGRIIRSEDQTWDKDLRATLAQLCLDLVIRDYPFFVQLTEESNKAAKLSDHEDHKKWETALENYQLRRRSYDRRVLQADLRRARKTSTTMDDDDFDDYDEVKGDSKTMETPEIVPSKFLEREQLKPVLDRLSDQDRVTAIEELDIKEIPLDLAIDTIPDNFYWKRVTLDRWPDADKDEHDEGNWRQYYLEKNLRELVEFFHPFEGQVDKLLEQIQLVAPHIRQLTLINLIPNCFGVESRPRIFKPFNEQDRDEAIKGEDEGFAYAEELKKMAAALKKSQVDDEPEYEDDMRSPRDNSHFDLSLMMPHLKFLRTLCIIYELQEMGMEWEARFCDFTDTDVENLAKALVLTPTIEHFELNRSRMTDEQCKILVRDGLIKMPHLKILNISYNNIRNGGAKAIARLLIENRAIHTLHTLSMARNKIKNKGAKALAYALTLNGHLTSLDLRLNLIGDSGCEDFGHALVKNRSLVSLNLAANRITGEGCYVISKMLQHNRTLLQLDLSSNDLGTQSGEFLAQTIRRNKNILKLDVRLADTGDFELDIEAYLKRNRNRVPYSLLDRDDVLPSEAESQMNILGGGSEGEEEDGETEEDEEGDEDEEEIFKMTIIHHDTNKSDSDSDQDPNTSKSLKNKTT